MSQEKSWRERNKSCFTLFEVLQVKHPSESRERWNAVVSVAGEIWWFGRGHGFWWGDAKTQWWNNNYKKLLYNKSILTVEAAAPQTEQLGVLKDFEVNMGSCSIISSLERLSPNILKVEVPIKGVLHWILLTEFLGVTQESPFIWFLWGVWGLLVEVHWSRYLRSRSRSSSQQTAQRLWPHWRETG